MIRSVSHSQTDSDDDPINYRRRAGKALQVRMGVPLADDDKDAEAVRGFMGLSLRDMATDSLDKGRSVHPRPAGAGRVRTGCAALHQQISRLIVADSMTSVALASYRASESALKQLCRRRSLVNFKDSTSIRLGEMGATRKTG